MVYVGGFLALRVAAKDRQKTIENFYVWVLK
jgi:hypothetical protein